MRDIKTIIKDLTEKYSEKNPFILCEKLNIQLMYDELGSINGYYLQIEKNDKFICINKNLDKTKQTFVCAHELGHALLHANFNTFILQKYTLNKKIAYEKEANLFANELLKTKI